MVKNLPLIKKTNPLLGILVATILYYSGARLGLQLSLPNGNASPVWPPSGLAVAVLLLGGYRLWPGVWLGSFLAYIQLLKEQGNITVALIGVGCAIGIGASLEALSCYFLNQRFIQVRYLFDQGKNIFKFLGTAAIGCLVSPPIGVISLCLSGRVPWDAFGYSCLTWWLGDLTGILVITPLILAWSRPILRKNFENKQQLNNLKFKIKNQKWFEIGLWLLLIGGIAKIAFGLRYPIEYLMIPLLVWAAFRFGRKGTTLAIFIVSAIAIWGSIHGVSSFIRSTLNESLLLLQAFIGSVTVTALVLSAIVTERQQAKIELEKINEELEHRVEQRTAELKAANQEICHLNECLKADNLRMAAELEITRRLQQMILPKESELTSIDQLEIAGYMEPASEVGGDYYDVIKQNGLVKIGIGDVTGHGLESGVLMIMVQTAVRTLLANNETDPVNFLKVINQTIYDNVQRMNSEKNLSLVLLDYDNGILRLSGQHEEIIVVRANGNLERIDTIDLGFPIGLEADIADFLAEVTVKLHRGDVVVLYTDGITEAEDMKGIQYSLERLCEVVKQNCQLSAHAIRQAVIDDVRRHIGEQKVYDDITLVVLKQK